MEELDIPARVLASVSTFMLCPLCDKPFTKELRYKRHISYCRKSGRRKRPRSCRACNLSKIKCNSCDPCHQCIRKGIQCIFDQQSWLDVQTQQHKKTDDVPSAMHVDAPDADTDTCIPSEMTQFLDDGTQGLDDDSQNNHFPDLAQQIREFPFCPLPPFPQLEYPGRKDGPDLSCHMLSDRISFPPENTTVTTTPKEDDRSMTLFDGLCNNNLSIPGIDFNWDDELSFSDGKELQSTLTTTLPQLLPTSQTTLTGHFTKNAVKSGIQQVCTTMIIDLIYAYPRMMMRRETLPPFIHSCSPAFPPDTETRTSSKLPKYLMNCMAIAQLFAACTVDTRPFIWSTIKTEMHSLRDNAETSDIYEALSALQACLVYLIIRAVDEGPQNAGDDYEMLVIYGDVCLKAMEHSLGCKSDPKSPNLRWKDWILMESNWRIACIWFILGLIYNTRTGRPCFVSAHFRELLLPCTKTEWEAKTECEWKKEHAAACSTTTLRTFGDLIEAQRGGSEGEKLGIWNAGIDHLGMAMSIAARMF